MVEDRYSQIFKLERVRPAMVVDGLGRAAGAPARRALVFCETRALAEEWTYRYLAAAHTWALDEGAAADRLGVAVAETAGAPLAPEPTTAEVRAWARRHGIAVPPRGRLRPEVWEAWRQRHSASTG